MRSSALVALLSLVASGAACGGAQHGRHHGGLQLTYVVPTHPGQAGLAIVEDDRTVEVAGNGRFVLDGLGDDVALDTLELRAEGGGVPWCQRAGDTAAVIACGGAEPGRQHVRLLYQMRARGLRLANTVTANLDAEDRGSVEVSTTVALTTPSWGRSAWVRVLLPRPDGSRRELYAADVALDGTALVAVAGHTTVVARIDAVYRAAGRPDGSGEVTSQPIVWDWLVIPDAAVAGLPLPWAPAATTVVVRWADGQVRVATVEAGAIAPPSDAHDRAVVSDGRPPAALTSVEASTKTAIDDPFAAEEATMRAELRVQLWPSDGLIGTRGNWQQSSGGESTSQSFLSAIINQSERRRRVWVEDLLPPAHGRRVFDAFPRPPSILDDVGIARLQLEVPPGKVAHAGYRLESQL